jgi:hypothetical protein
MVYRSQPLHFIIPAFPTKEVQEAMDSFNSRWLAKHDLTEGSHLYHYTILSGMRGILNDRALWYGHASSLNDPSEMQYGKKIISNVLNDAMKRQDREDLRVFQRQLLVQVQAFGEAMFHAFVACFCDSGNLLSQWRAYANRGGGYCLEFAFSSVTRFAPDLGKLVEGQSPYLRKVIYEEDEQRELVTRYVDTVAAAAKKALDRSSATSCSDQSVSGLPAVIMTRMAMHAVNILLDMLLCFKHPAFKEEKEWRLVRVTSEDHQPENLQFRETTGGLVPYRPTHIYDMNETGQPVFPLRSIGFGPTLDSVRTSAAITLLLHRIASDQHLIALPSPYQIKIREPGYNLRSEEAKQ